MTQIHIPVPAPGSGYCYAKLKRTGDYASAASAVMLRSKGGLVEDVRIALTSVGPTPLRAAHLVPRLAAVQGAGHQQAKTKT